MTKARRLGTSSLAMQHRHSGYYKGSIQPKEIEMAESGKSKRKGATPRRPARAGGGNKPVPTLDLAAEQAREVSEAARARDAEASSRDRMVEIGRAHRQAGRQGS